MTGARVVRGESAGAALRWGACLLVVLGLHAGLALALLRRAPRPEPAVPAPDAVMLELAPIAAPAAMPEAPPQPADPPSPGPKPDAEPPPVEAPPPVEPPPSAEPPSPMEPPALPMELPPPPEPEPPPVSFLPQPAVTLPEPPLPPPAPKRPVPPRPARPPPRPAQASPSPPAPQAPASTAAPAPAPPPAASAAPSPGAFPGWQSELSSRLQRAKRYPEAAQARDEQGAAAVTFTIDRSGHVLSAKLVRSSGSPSLDEEAMATLRRADPLPPMPSELPGSTLTFTVLVKFFLR